MTTPRSTDRKGHCNGRRPDAGIVEPHKSFVIARLEPDFRGELTWPGEVAIGTSVNRSAASVTPSRGDEDQIGEVVGNSAASILTDCFNVVACVDNNWPILTMKPLRSQGGKGSRTSTRSATRRSTHLIPIGHTMANWRFK